MHTLRYYLIRSSRSSGTFRTFNWYLVPDLSVPSSRVMQSKSLKNMTDRLYRKVGNEPPINAAQWPRRAKTSVTPLRKSEETHSRHALESIMKVFNLLNPTGHMMHQQFNIQQLYVLPTLYLCVLYLSENKQWLVPLTA